MHAIILAAGFGKRTQGVLCDMPKCLVKTADGKTILEHLLLDFSSVTSIHHIIIATNGKYFPAIDESVSSYKDIIVTSNRKENPNDRFGALGDLNYAIITEKIEDEIFVTPSDTTYWHSFSLKSFYEFQKKFPNDFVMVVRDVMDKNVIRGRFGNPVMNKKNIITSFVEKPDEPASTLVAAPFYIYRKKHIALLRQYLHEGGNPDSPGMIISYLLKHKQTVRGFIVKNKIIDAGTPQDIEEAKKY